MKKSEPTNYYIPEDPAFSTGGRLIFKCKLIFIRASDNLMYYGFNKGLIEDFESVLYIDLDIDRAYIFSSFSNKHVLINIQIPF
jgi:hypothetical protein